MPASFCLVTKANYQIFGYFNQFLVHNLWLQCIHQFLLCMVASYSRRAPVTCDIKIGVLWTFYSCGSPAFASIVGITRPRSKLVVSILHRRTAGKESIRHIGGWYRKPMCTGAIVWICFCTPFTINRTISFLYQSMSVPPYK